MTKSNALPTATTLFLGCVGIVLVANQMALARIVSGMTDPAAKLPLVVLLVLSGALAFILAPHLRRVPPTTAALLLVFAAGLAMRAVWFGTPAAIEDDYNRYMWDGAVVANGLDPYRYPPSNFLSSAIPTEYEAIARAGRAALEHVNFPELGSLYPTVAQLSFALAYFIAPFNLDALRCVFMVVEVVTFLLLVALLEDLRVSPVWSALYWWNPLAIFTLIGMAHVDALVPAFVLGALLAARRGRTNAAVALLGAGAGVKLWPLLLAPLILLPLFRQAKRMAWAAVVLILVLALAGGPLLVAALRPGSGITAYAAGWEINNGFFAWAVYGLEFALDDEARAQAAVRALLVIATAVTALIAALRHQQHKLNLTSAASLVAAAVFYLSPAQFPWYATWFLPLAALIRSRPLLLASATVPLCYLSDPLWYAGWGDAYHYGLSFLHALPVLLWLIADAARLRWTARKGCKCPSTRAS
jgi:alpha-1,6-mannosyltransferase